VSYHFPGAMAPHDGGKALITIRLGQKLIHVFDRELAERVLFEDASPATPEVTHYADDAAMAIRSLVASFTTRPCKNFKDAVYHMRKLGADAHLIKPSLAIGAATDFRRHFSPAEAERVVEKVRYFLTEQQGDAVFERAGGRPGPARGDGNEEKEEEEEVENVETASCSKKHNEKQEGKQEEEEEEETEKTKDKLKEEEKEKDEENVTDDLENNKEKEIEEDEKVEEKKQKEREEEEEEKERQKELKLKQEKEKKRLKLQSERFTIRQHLEQGTHLSKGLSRSQMLSVREIVERELAALDS